MHKPSSIRCALKCVALIQADVSVRPAWSWAPWGLLTTCLLLCTGHAAVPRCIWVSTEAMLSFPKHCITINDSSLTTSLQWRSVAKHQEHRCRSKRKMLNDMAETAKRKEPSTPHTDISRWVSDGKDFQKEVTSVSSPPMKLSSPKTPLPVSPFSRYLLNPLKDWLHIFTSWKWVCPLLFATLFGILDCNLIEVNTRPYITKRKKTKYS